MPNTLMNYDGSISSTPREIVSPETVEDIQAVLRNRARFPSPVRAVGSNHSLTPCAATRGTVVDMSRMTKVLDIDTANGTFTAQAGLQVIDASKALREKGVQLHTNIEIGNLTLGAGACCHTKDGLDGIEYGQFSSYATRIKWVTPAGELAEADDASFPDLMKMMRASHGLAGVIYEVTYRIKPLEALHFSYLPVPVEELTQEMVDEQLDGSEGLMAWSIGRMLVFQRRTRVTDAGILEPLLAAGRRRLWDFTIAHWGHFIDQFLTNKSLRDAAEKGFVDAENLLMSSLHLFGGITLLAPDKIIDYRQTAPPNRYAFTFWGFPRAQWLATLRAYLDFADAYFKRTGFHINMPCGAYHIRKDQSSTLSYSWDGDAFSLDPIHAPADLGAWQDFLKAFNEFAYQHGGSPLLNQSPFVERRHVEQAYGQRWADFSAWVREMDPDERMLNPFFSNLLTPKAT
jgi:hypothetical protein